MQSESSLASIHRTFGGSVQPSGSHAAGYLARIPYMHLVHPALFGARRWCCTKHCIYGDGGAPNTAYTVQRDKGCELRHKGSVAAIGGVRGVEPI